MARLAGASVPIEGGTAAVGKSGRMGRYSSADTERSVARNAVALRMTGGAVVHRTTRLTAVQHRPTDPNVVRRMKPVHSLQRWRAKGRKAESSVALRAEVLRGVTAVAAVARATGKLRMGREEIIGMHAVRPHPPSWQSAHSFSVWHVAQSDPWSAAIQRWRTNQSRPWCKPRSQRGGLSHPSG